MNKTYLLPVIVFFVIFACGCKKESRSAPTNNKPDYNKLIIGNWYRSAIVDTQINAQSKIISDSVSLLTYVTNNNYVFNSDGSGNFSEASKVEMNYSYNFSGSSIKFFNIQGFDQNGIPSGEHILPFYKQFVKLTSSTIIFRTDTTIGSGESAIRYIDRTYYTKWQ